MEEKGRKRDREKEEERGRRKKEREKERKKEKEFSSLTEVGTASSDRGKVFSLAECLLCYYSNISYQIQCLTNK